MIGNYLTFEAATCNFNRPLQIEINYHNTSRIAVLLT